MKKTVLVGIGEAGQMVDATGQSVKFHAGDDIEAAPACVRQQPIEGRPTILRT